MKDNKHLETIVVFMAVVNIFYLLHHNIYLVYISLFLAAIGILLPSLSKKIHWAWMKLAEGLGFVMNKLILGAVFYIFLVPIALVSRLFRKAPISDKTGSSTYFKERNFRYSKESFENLW